MTWTLPAEVVPTAISGVLLAGFSIWIGSMGGGTPRSRAFATFGVGFGLSAAVSNMTAGFADVTALGRGEVAAVVAIHSASILLTVASAYGLHRLTRLMIPGGVPTRLLILVGALVFLDVVPFLAYLANSVRLLGAWVAWSALGLNLASDAMITVMWSAGIASAFAYPRMDPSGARDLAVLTAVVSVYPAQFMTYLSAGFVWTMDPWQAVNFAAAMVLVLATAAAWLRAGQRRGGSHTATLVALLPLATALVMAWTFFQGGGSLSGYARAFVVVVLAYAVLRHQMFGLDATIRFAISKSTIAGAFVTVFFVASEAAQQFFGSTFSSAYVGIVAAGALVFALAPLQRAAERLAEKAVPLGPASPPTASPFPAAHERYRTLLRRFLRDGQITREEEMALAHAASGMGISAHEALRLRHEIEDEQA